MGAQPENEWLLGSSTGRWGRVAVRANQQAHPLSPVWVPSEVLGRKHEELRARRDTQRAIAGLGPPR